MTEDLNKLDDMFVRGLEGYREELPPAVWDAVNNDLDKKQVSYYKNRYYRLKAAAFVVVLSCIFSAAFIFYRNHEKVPPPVDVYHFENQPDAAVDSQIISKPVTIDKQDKQLFDTNNAAVNVFKKQVDRVVTSNDILKTADQTHHQSSPNSVVDPVERSSFKAVDTSLTQKIVIDGSAASKQTAVDMKPLVHQVNGGNDGTELAPADLSYFLIPTRSDAQNLFNQFPQKIIVPFSSSLATSQTILSKRKMGISMSIFGAPNVSFHRLEDNDRITGPGRNRQDEHHQENHMLSWSGGVLANLSVSNKINIQSGVTVTTITNRIAPKTVYATANNPGKTQFELQSSLGYSYLDPKEGTRPAIGDSAKTSETASSLVYIGIPISVNYKIIAGKFSFYPGVGVGFNILTSAKTKTSLLTSTGSEGRTSSIKGLRAVYAEAQAGFGIEYLLNRKISIGLRPNARFALMPINRDTPVKSYQNFLSIESGIRIKL